MTALVSCLRYLQHRLSAHEAQAFPAVAKGPSITAIAQEQLLERFAPPAVIVTEKGDIVYFHGHTGPVSGAVPGERQT